MQSKEVEMETKKTGQDVNIQLKNSSKSEVKVCES